MKRWRVILLCLLAGAAVNVLVAWECDFAHQHDWERRAAYFPVQSSGSEPWPIRVPATWPDSADQAVGTRRLGFSAWQGGAAFGEGVVGPAAVVGLAVVESGWPARSLGRRRWSWSGSAAAVPGATRRVFGPSFTLPGWAHRFQSDPFSPVTRLSLGILWPGFAINTLLYAALLWAPLFAAGAVRRRRRRCRGRCPRCAYDLHSMTGPCPECGTPREAAP